MSNVPEDSILESEHLIDNALLIAQLEKEIDDFPEQACCGGQCQWDASLRKITRHLFCTI